MVSSSQKRDIFFEEGQGSEASKSERYQDKKTESGASVLTKKKERGWKEAGGGDGPT